MSHWKMFFQRGRKHVGRLTTSFLSHWKMVFQRGRKQILRLTASFLSCWKMVFQRGRKQILSLTASYLSHWKMVFQRGRKKREAPFYSQSEFMGFKVNSASNFEISTFNQTNMTNWARICISYKKTIENWTS